MVTVALDAMGGDDGVEAAVRGAALLSTEPSDVSVLLVGDVASVNRVLSKVSYDPTRITLVDSAGVVAMHDKPSEALERMPNCSVLTACRLVADGQADGLVSAGHTGATILASARSFERLPGVERAGLAAVYPTEKRHGPKGDPFALMLDVGATLDASAEDLVAFAVMGAAYSSVISEIPRPTVALLSNGTEANKGTKAIVAAHRHLTEHAAAAGMTFGGNVEGLDIPRGTVDVVVCDGFLGNVVLKMLEGVSEVARDVAVKASGRKLQWRMGLAMLGGGLRQLRRMTDWKVYGGAPLLGFDQVVIKAHGRSEARAIRNAIKVAAKAADGQLVPKLKESVGAAFAHLDD